MRSLRKMCSLTLLVTVLLFGVLLYTGVRQNSLTKKYDSIVEQIESTIFHYATIREEATEGVLTKDPARLSGAAKEFKQLHVKYTSILDNHLIPNQYKLSFLQKLDLEQMVINLRNLSVNLDEEILTHQVIKQLRQINYQFLKFDRIVVGEMRSRVIHYQRQGLILMGLIVFLTCFTLILLYLKSIRPLVQIAEQAEQALVTQKPLKLDNEKNLSEEVRALIVSFNQLQKKPAQESNNTLTNSLQSGQFSKMFNDVTNRLNAIINYTQLLLDYFEKNNIDGDQKKILFTIIDNGEKSAVVLKKCLRGGD